jgi:hypothetical protein
MQGEEVCSSGCLSKNHESYGACLRAKHLQVQDVETHKRATAQNRVIDDYVAARRDGLQPEGVTAKAVKQAREFTDLTGTPFRADK